MTAVLLLTQLHRYIEKREMAVYLLISDIILLHSSVISNWILKLSSLFFNIDKYDWFKVSSTMVMCLILVGNLSIA